MKQHGISTYTHQNLFITIICCDCIPNSRAVNTYLDTSTLSGSQQQQLPLKDDFRREAVSTHNSVHTGDSFVEGRYVIDARRGHEPFKLFAERCRHLGWIAPHPPDTVALGDGVLSARLAHHSGDSGDQDQHGR